YRGQSNLDLELEALLEGVVDFAGIDIPLLYQLEARTIAAFTPQQVVVGLSVTRVPRFRFNFDLTWIDWSAYESPTAQIAAVLEVEPPPATPINLPESPAPVVVVPPAFEDRVVPRFGIEYDGVALGAPRMVHGVA